MTTPAKPEPPTTPGQKSARGQSAPQSEESASQPAESAPASDVRYLVAADDLPRVVLDLLPGNIDLLPWSEVASAGVVSEMASPSDRGPLLPAVSSQSSPNVSHSNIVGLLTYGHVRVDDALLQTLPALRVISNHGVGVDHIDTVAAKRRGIAVGNTPGAMSGSSADMTFALLLAAARLVVSGDRFARGPGFTHYDPAAMLGREVTGSTLGIVGLGRIGREVARRAAGFDMPVLYFNRNRDLAAEQLLGVQYAGSLDELLSRADFVTLNCPLTAETNGMIGTAQLAKMKATAILVNMARGAVVKTDALYAALKSRRIAAAALDVTDPEPLPRNHPLLELDNVVITPHLGSASDKTRERMAKMTVENLVAGLQGRPLPYQFA